MGPAGLSRLAERLAAAAPCDLEGDGGTVRPRTVAELAEAARALRQSRARAALRGVRAGPRWGAPPEAEPPWRLSLAGLSGSALVEPIDLVLSAGAGFPLAKARALAAAHGLELPLEDPPTGPGTLGGLLARGEGRGARLGPAGPRATLLGLTAVSPDGTVVKAGGRVVKNVAGIDTHRLFVGSMGTLGAIAEVHLKLVPSPGGAQVLRWDGEAMALAELALTILQAAPQIEALWLDEAPASDRAATLRARIRGSASRLACLRDRLHVAAGGFLEDAPGVMEALPAGGWLLRARCSPRRLPALLASWLEGVRSAPAEARLRVHPDSGEIWLACGAGASRSEVEDLARSCVDAGGHFFAAARAAGFRDLAWKPEPRGLRFWRALKQRLDPEDLWNPGILSPA